MCERHQKNWKEERPNSIKIKGEDLIGLVQMSNLVSLKL